MYILGLHTGHDACAVLYDEYRLLAAVPLERITRQKNDGDRYPQDAVREVLEEVGITQDQIDVVALGRCSPFWDGDGYIQPASLMKNPNWYLRRLYYRLFHKTNAIREPYWHAKYAKKSVEDIFDAERFYKNLSFPQKPRLFFSNHHFAHALGALFHTDWDDTLLYTADGGGDGISYSHRTFKDGALQEYWGGEEDTIKGAQKVGSSSGELYAMTTGYLGFKVLRHEGKVLGLAARGNPRFMQKLMSFFYVDDEGRVFSSKSSRHPLRRCIKYLAKAEPREDVAASVQKTLEALVLDAIGKLLKRHKVRHLALSGGVFANVRLNQRIAEELPVDEIFIYPSMGDQGLAAGAVLEYLLQRDGLKRWLSKRHRLRDVYLGRNYDEQTETIMKEAGAKPLAYEPMKLQDKVAELLHEGKIVALYCGRMEYGPRALGARSILAAPTDPHVNDWLNKRLSRTEFMPFAPVVSAERAEEIFDISPSMLYAARFMTITCNVKKEWRDKVPAVVHVDGTARPQIITREENPLYYDILQSYEKRTGLPVLINTSFNAHEEPIINTPKECVNALLKGRVDYVATHNAIWEK